ncbi:MAG: HAD-IA family hydrolase, partial [Hyphomicrobiaceae bacterium]
DEIYQELFARLAEGVSVIPGVLDVLDGLDADAVPYCVGSNGPMAKMTITLTPSGLWHRLEGRIFSPHVIGMEHAKPAPGLFLHAARTMGVTPDEAVVIEDRYSGASAARAAGMRCFGYSAETPPEQLIEAGATPFDDMADLPGLLKLMP